MFINRKTIGLVVSAWAVLSAVGRFRKHKRVQDTKARKEQMTTWENEGGNLPPSQTSINPVRVPAAT